MYIAVTKIQPVRKRGGLSHFLEDLEISLPSLRRKEMIFVWWGGWRGAYITPTFEFLIDAIYHALYVTLISIKNYFFKVCIIPHFPLLAT